MLYIDWTSLEILMHPERHTQGKCPQGATHRQTRFQVQSISRSAEAFITTHKILLSDTVDAQGAGTQIVRRFYYVAVRNLHHHKTARNCYVYLEKVIRLGGPSVEIPFGSVELKWAGYTLPNAHILPETARPFDALFTHHAQPTLVGFNVFSDSSLFGHPPIQAAGEYEFRYSVVSDNFPIARASLILSLSSTLDSTTLKLKAGGD